MSTIITALAVLAFIGGIVALLVFVNNRDQKRDKLKRLNAPDNTGVK